MTMKKNRFISFILSAVMVLSLCSSAFAVSLDANQNYDVKDENPFAIVIRDAAGNIVETYYQTPHYTSTGLSIIFPQAEL